MYDFEIYKAIWKDKQSKLYEVTKTKLEDETNFLLNIWIFGILNIKYKI